jgi:hypothetical protein
MSAFVRKKGDDTLALELAAGKSLREAAQMAGIAERTARRRMDAPDFRRRVSEIRDRVLGEAIGRLVDAASNAVGTLSELLSSDSETVRLNAARTILGRVVELRDSIELADRITKLETALECKTNGTS